MSVTIWAALWGPQGDFPCVTLVGPEVPAQVLATPSIQTKTPDPETWSLFRTV